MGEEERLFGDCVSLYAVIEHLNSLRCHNSAENRLRDELGERYKRIEYYMCDRHTIEIVLQYK